VLAVCFFSFQATPTRATPVSSLKPSPLRVSLVLVKGPDGLGCFQAQALVEARVSLENLEMSMGVGDAVEMEDPLPVFQGPLKAGQRLQFKLQGMILEPWPRIPPSLSLGVRYQPPEKIASGSSQVTSGSESTRRREIIRLLPLAKPQPRWRRNEAR
jgi:hypothetical protein